MPTYGSTWSPTCRHEVRVTGGRGKSGLFRSDSPVRHALLRADSGVPARARGGWPATAGAGPARLDHRSLKRDGSVRPRVGVATPARRGFSRGELAPGILGAAAGDRASEVAPRLAWGHAEDTRPLWRPGEEAGLPARCPGRASQWVACMQSVTAHWHGLLALGSWLGGHCAVMPRSMNEEMDPRSTPTSRTYTSRLFRSWWT